MREDPIGPSLLMVGDVFWVALVVSAILAYPIWRLLIKLKSQQNVSAHLESHQVKQGTPTMGGFIIVAGALAAYLFLATKPMVFGSSANLGLAALVLLVGFCSIGFIDDFVAPRYLGMRRGLGWKHKIVMQVAVAAAGAFLANGWQWAPSVGLGIFLILFFSNAYNFADGLDGLAGTLLIGLAGGLAALAWHSVSGASLTLLVAPLFAAVIPFLFLNAPPAKVFMGDAGSLPIGAILGLVVSQLIWTPTVDSAYALYPYPNLAAVWPQVRFGPEGLLNLPMVAAVLIASLMMVAELVPVPLQILSVKVLKRRFFKFKTPIHHAFEDLGWKETRITASFALAQLLLSVLALGIYLHWSTISAR